MSEKRATCEQNSIEDTEAKPIVLVTNINSEINEI